MADPLAYPADRFVQTGLRILRLLLDGYRPRDFAVRLWDGTIWGPEEGQTALFTLVIHRPGVQKTPGVEHHARAKKFKGFLHLERLCEALEAFARRAAVEHPPGWIRDGLPLTQDRGCAKKGYPRWENPNFHISSFLPRSSCFVFSSQRLSMQGKGGADSRLGWNQASIDPARISKSCGYGGDPGRARRRAPRIPFANLTPMSGWEWRGGWRGAG
jgi:hypothetical protein